MSGPGSEPEVSELLMKAAHRLRHSWMASLEPWQLSPHEFRALRAISQADTSRLSDLADRLGIANRSVTEVVDSLEDKGLVARAPSPTDRRAVTASLTSEGSRLIGEIGTARAAAGAQFLDPLTPAQRQSLRTLLTRLLQTPPG